MLKLTDPTLLKSAAYVNGAWVDAGARFAVTNPSTGETIAELPNQTPADASAAVDAAAEAFPAWAKKTAKERATLMRKWFDEKAENFILRPYRITLLLKALPCLIWFAGFAAA